MRIEIQNIQERLETKDIAGVGSDIDQRYDAVFRKFLKEADSKITAITKELNKYSICSWSAKNTGGQKQAEYLQN